MTTATNNHHPFATDLTAVSSATNPHVDFPTHATNVTVPATLAVAALMLPVPHSDLKPANPLPHTVNTPVNIANFSASLTHHPDQHLVQYLVNDLTHGFSIGFKGPHSPSQPQNLLSATAHSVDVTTALCKELSCGHTAGPFITPPWPDIHCSPLGSREKKDGSRRLIMDLSQPRNHSINDGIAKDNFPVHYSQFDDATNLVYNQGRHCLMSKIDIKHAFHLLPVNPAQWILLGIFWLGHFFVDTRLPFGLRSSPAIFNKFADAICWIIRHVYNILNIVHYSDDFFLVSSSNRQQAAQDLHIVKSAFSHLGVPIAENKLEGPSTSITYLGININSDDFTIRIPTDKYIELCTLLPMWLQRKKCTKQELLSLIGKLSFICKVVRPGRIFLRRLIDLSTSVQRLHHHISINKEAQYLNIFYDVFAQSLVNKTHDL